jgi:type IV pilus assembly protein PilM
MPSAPRFLALNLGMQHVGLAAFRATSGGGLTLLDWNTVELIVDPAADATRGAQIEAAVAEMRGTMGVSAKEKGAVTLPSQSVFSRFVKLPGGSPEDVEQIIGFEAQQNVPFPIDEVVWDHQIMGEARAGSWDVVLVAIKADQLGETVTAVEKGGLKPTTIDAAPVAIYNALRFNYPELSGCSLVVDVGARTTNLIFVEGQRLFSRTIPVGGNSISAAVAKEFRQDITVAERLKIEKGFVGLGGAYEEPEDPTVAKIAKVVRNTMTRLHAEIARSISFYRQSQGGSAPVRAYLAGGTVSMRYMLEFFGEKLQIPVEHFNALRNVTVATPELAQRVSVHAHAMGELVGGALRAAGDCPVEINLRPRALAKEQDLAKRKPFLVLAAVCVLAALGAWYGFFWKAGQVAQQKLDETTQIASGLEALAKQLDAVAEEKKAAEASAAPLLAAIEERTAWSAIIDELAQNLPPRFIWVTKLTPILRGKQAPGAGGQPAAPPRPGQQQQQQGPPAITGIEITGLYVANPPNESEARIIDQFVAKLQKSPLFKIEDITKAVTQRTTPDGQSWAYAYTISVPLAKEIPLP